MKIVITGKNTKIKHSEMRKAAKFMMSLLVPKRLYNSLSIDIEYANIPNCKGTTEYLDTNDRPRMFKVTISPSISKKNQLLTLAHELTHVKQFAKGELMEYQKKHNSAMRWGNEIIQYDDETYWDAPWEIEAYGREIGLYIRYIDHKLDRGK
jgi:hypothetical protein